MPWLTRFCGGPLQPQSGRRTRQIVEAQRLFLRHRSPDTPVAIVKSAYRRRERIEFTTLAHMSDADIGMLSTVLIGNSNTVVQNGLMVTPRGYANKYDVQAGAPRARASALAGRSTGLNGWLENLFADHAAGDSIEALAQRHRLPVEYIRDTLENPLEAAAQDAPEEAEASTESTDTTNAAVAADTATPEVVRPKISDYRRHLLICTGPAAPKTAGARPVRQPGRQVQGCGFERWRTAREAQPRGLLCGLQGRPGHVRAARWHLVLQRHPRQHGPHHHRAPGGRAASAGAGVSPGAHRG